MNRRDFNKSIVGGACFGPLLVIPPNNNFPRDKIDHNDYHVKRFDVSTDILSKTKWILRGQMEFHKDLKKELRLKTHALLILDYLNIPDDWSGHVSWAWRDAKFIQFSIRCCSGKK